ncbi:DNA ligase [compost metagenome]
MQNEISSLRAELTRLNDLYYNKGESDVEDEVYDSLKRRLQELEGTSDDPLSPLNRVGAPSSGGFAKIRHLSPMLSLQNLYNEQEVVDWVTNIGRPYKASIEMKLDGASLDLMYHKGRLAYAATRGDGETGDDITENAVYFEGVPIEVPSFDFNVEVRGEVICLHHHFKIACERRLAEGKSVYANPRNMVAGLMRKKEGAALQGLGLRFIAYDIIIHTGANPTSVPVSHVEDSLTGLFNIVDSVWEGALTSTDQIMDAINKLAELRKELDYDIDGAVLKINEPGARTTLGNRSTSPRWAAAYKFEAQTTTSVLESIDVQVGRTGVMTPVAKIRPVNLCGVTISSVTLHNFDEIARLDLRLLDTVIVSRRGDVIPKIEGIVKALRMDEHGVINPPVECPSCGHPVATRGDGIELFCTNMINCPAQIVNRMAYFVSRDGIDVKNLGPASIEALIASGSLGSFSSLFHLSESDFYAAGIGEAMTDKIMASIERSKNLPFYKVLRAVGISEIGDSTARAIAERYSSFGAIAEASQQDLRNIPDVGPVVALNLFQAMAANGSDLFALDKILTYTEDTSIKMAEVQDLAGKTVVVTGSDFNGKTRKQMEADVISRGGKLASGVSKNTDYVYVGAGAGPEKVRKAKELHFTEDGIRLINPNTVTRVSQA